MTKELVALTKEQADAVEAVLARHSKEYAVELFFDEETWGPWTDSFEPISDMTADVFIRALYVGYTVEKTQEERKADVKAWYEDYVYIRDNTEKGGDPHTARLYDARMVGCKETLTILGIHIEGVTEQ